METRVILRRLALLIGLGAFWTGPLAAAPVTAGRPAGLNPASLVRGQGAPLRPGNRRASRFQPGAATRLSPPVNPVRVAPTAPTAPRRR